MKFDCRSIFVQVVREVLKTLPNIYDGAILRYWLTILVVNDFRKKASS